ncbi:MAG: DUF1837 domain-containing protein [Thermodesulfobacteriota bacterium]|nr:DUF1837 domain-containing protein [Thermodesulfobacteriota bacterium]
MSLNEEGIKNLLSNTDSFISHVFWFSEELPNPPGKGHYGTAINYVDIQERKDDFLRELRNTICNWVYSKARYSELFDKELEKRGLDPQNAASHIESLAKKKFRRDAHQGQFGELLLFNFLQYFFRAPPLLRKMPITTSSGMERYGADAIHYKPNGKDNVFYLGEAKAYTSKYQFNTAFREAVSSIIKTYEGLQDELLLYIYDEFVDVELQIIAEHFKEGILENTKIELVCLISYNESKSINGANEPIIKENIRRVILDRCRDVDPNIFQRIDNNIVERFHYIIFPFWNFDTILNSFAS